jgi:hypothetical protein
MWASGRNLILNYQIFKILLEFLVEFEVLKEPTQNTYQFFFLRGGL